MAQSERGAEKGPTGH